VITGVAQSQNSDRSNTSGSAARPVLSVNTGYERWAQTYDDSHNPLLALEQRRIASMLPALAGKRALDVACGTGRWFRLLAARGVAHLIGVDISRAMLRIAATKVNSSLALIQADCTAIPLHDGEVDFAICSFAAGHVSNLDGFAAECSRVLRADAELFLTDLHPDAYSAGWRTGFRDHRGSAEIETIARSCDQVVNTFGSNRFHCIGTYGFGFEQSEWPIFVAARKEKLFAMASQLRAVLVCRFRKLH
jgi:ubiquinone/menaquinone biosynthesis C-methylase UbiE